MKKTTKKLAINKETLSMFMALSEEEIAYIQGGIADGSWSRINSKCDCIK